MNNLCFENEESLPPAHDFDAFISPESGDASQKHLLNSIVVPRPIAFVTSKGTDGTINAAPFSYFNIICSNPAMISLAIERRNGLQKDTARNITLTGEFVVNICSVNLAQSINIAKGDFPPHISEIELTNLSLLPSRKIAVPRIANTYVQLECVLKDVVVIAKGQGELILAEVVQFHLHKDILDNQGRVDIAKLNPLARLSGLTYARVSDFFDVSNRDTGSPEKYTT